MRKISICIAVLLAAITVGCGSNSGGSSQNSSSSHSSSSSSSAVCTAEYVPICGAKQVQCVTTPCDRVPQTYTNRCEFDKDSDVEFIHDGECNASTTIRSVIDADQIVNGGEKFAHELFKKLANNSDNLLISPLSIHTALSMTYAGTKGETASEFEKLFYFDNNLSVHDSFKELLTSSQSKTNEFNLANSLWPSTLFTLRTSYVDTLTKEYNSTITQLDYKNNPDANAIINQWVEDQTEEKIKDLVPKLTGTTKLVLVNTVYFLGTWLSEFDHNKTIKEQFLLSSDESVEIDMMHLTAEFNASSNSMFKTIELPYANREFSMFVVLPNSGETISSCLSHMEDLKLDTLKNSLYQQIVTLSLPKFKFSWGTKSLKSVLEELGLKKIFSNSADLGLMAQVDIGDLVVSDVLHKTFIEVDESGTEAAAATAVVVDVASMGFGFNANRAFIFLIKDNSTGSLVFMGVVADPSK